MKIHLPNQSGQSLGGGFTFRRTFEKFLLRAGHESVKVEDADIVFVSGATMVTRDFVMEQKAKGKKIVLRVDNIPRNSRNRNTGTSRLHDFAQAADLVIYQSQWAKDFISPFLRKDGPVILNGADEDVFKPSGPNRPADGEPQYLYCQFNRDETKQWHVAWYDYIQIQRRHPKAHLWIAGNFSPELQQYKFDFFMGERVEYLGVISEPEEMAEIYRGTNRLLIPYYNDACSQTLIEARCCGVYIENANLTGGTPEIIASDVKDLTASAMTAKYITELSRL